MREIFLRKSRILFAFCSLMLVSCVDPYKCTNEINTNQITVISVISTKPVKSVKAYMGDKVLCEGVNELLYRKNKEDLLYHYTYDEGKIDSEREDWFVVYGCYVIHDTTVKNGKVYFDVEENDSINVLDVDDLIMGKTHIYAISLQDTAWLFGYKSSLLVNDAQNYDFSV